MAFDLSSVLGQFTGGKSSPDVHNDFQTVAENAPSDMLSKGLSAMFSSPQTPPFGQMAGQLFGRAAPNQQAGMLSQLLGGMGPSVLASLASGVGGGALGNMLSRFGGGGSTPVVTPDQASQLTPADVETVANHAEQHSPGIIDKMSEFYAQHPGLVKTLGGAALTVAMAKMAEQR